MDEKDTCEDHLRKLEDYNRFLNLLIDNINSAVLLADEHLNIYRANRSFLSQFGDPEKTIPGGPFGKATGCVHSVEERVACGETSLCEECVIRGAPDPLSERVGGPAAAGKGFSDSGTFPHEDIRNHHPSPWPFRDGPCI